MSDSGRGRPCATRRPGSGTPPGNTTSVVGASATIDDPYKEPLALGHADRGQLIRHHDLNPLARALDRDIEPAGLDLAAQRGSERGQNSAPGDLPQRLIVGLERKRLYPSAELGAKDPLARRGERALLDLLAHVVGAAAHRGPRCSDSERKRQAGGSAEPRH